MLVDYLIGKEIKGYKGFIVFILFKVFGCDLYSVG